MTRQLSVLSRSVGFKDYVEGRINLAVLDSIIAQTFGKNTVETFNCIRLRMVISGSDVFAAVIG